MARLVAAFASSHSIMLTTELEDWLVGFREADVRLPLFDKTGANVSFDDLLVRAPADAEERVAPQAIARNYERTHKAIAELKRRIDATELDALIIVGDDQHELFQDAMMPALAIYYGETIRNAAQSEMKQETWYQRAQSRRLEPEAEVHYPVHAGLALHCVEDLAAQGFDVCAVREIEPEQYEGHAFSFIHRTYLKERVLPVIPVLLNTYYGPNPVMPKRCIELGYALSQAIAAYPEDMRVGIIASGGLSHFVLDEELDHGVIKALKEKDFAYLAALHPKNLQAGSSEIRSWMVAAAAAHALTLDWVEYVPAYRTPALTGTGLGFAAWK